MDVGHFFQVQNCEGPYTTGVNYLTSSSTSDTGLNLSGPKTENSLDFDIKV